MKLQVNNFEMAFDDHGKGLPLLFVHGYPLGRRMWAPQLASLSEAARVLAPDLRGHGDSQAVPGPYWMDTLADDLAAFLDALGVHQPVVMCGLSMGGYITMAFYRRHSRRLAGMILTATRAGPDSEEGKANRDKSAALAREKGVTAIAESMLPKLVAPTTLTHKPELVKQIKGIMEATSLEGVLGDLQGLRERPDSLQTLREVELPTLIIHGADDQLIPLKEAEVMHAAMRSARLDVLPEAGHLLNMEQPELFNTAVKSFLKSLP